MPQRWRTLEGAPPPLTDICAVDELELGAARVFAFGRGWRAFELIVVRAADGVNGYANVCPHQPLPLNIDSHVRATNDLIFCDHHYAAFRFADGLCIEGVCQGESLIPVALTVECDRVRIADC